MTEKILNFLMITFFSTISIGMIYILIEAFKLYQDRLW